MPSVGGIINFFKYINKNKIENIEFNYGDKWSECSTENKIINSIFSMVDDGDGIIQPEEVNKLNKILLYIDRHFGGKEENILEKKN